jgi:hypothetical protein
MVLLVVWLLRRRRLYPLGRWQQDARHQLLALRRRMKREPAKQVAGELSELLRRCARGILVSSWRGVRFFLLNCLLKYSQAIPIITI